MISKEEIASYLNEVKALISLDNYNIEFNDNRKKNQDLFIKYVIDENRAKKILLDLDVMDFVEILDNDNPLYKDEKLYVFGKNIQALERYGSNDINLLLYIKMNKLDEYVIIVSFHETSKINYYFK